MTRRQDTLLFDGLAVWTRCVVLSFILFSALLTLQHLATPQDDIALRIRAGVLDDVLAEEPRGRQGLVCSLRILPMPSLLAFPFLPMTSAGARAPAILYGIALAMAAAVPCLELLLRKLRVRAPVALSVAALTALAFSSPDSVGSGYATAVSMLLVAFTLDLQDAAVARAMSGTFYGMALLSHPLGVVAAAARMIAAFPDLTGRRGNSSQGTASVMAVQIAYGLAVYLFLVNMVMGTPWYAMRNFSGNRLRGIPHGELKELESYLEEKADTFAPVVSGLWGYAATPTIIRATGHHAIDFHPARLPAWEKRDPLLIIPGTANPLRGYSDLDPEMAGDGHLKGTLALRLTPSWEFYLLRRDTSGESVKAR